MTIDSESVMHFVEGVGWMLISCAWLTQGQKWFPTIAAVCGIVAFARGLAMGWPK